MEVFDHLEADEIVTVLSAVRNPTAYFQPSIYSKISWEWNTVPRARILHLLQAILLCPKLASNIQHVSILSSPRYVRLEEWEGDPRDDQDVSLWNQNSEGFSDVIEQSQSIVNKAQFPEASKWHQALEMGNSYAYVAILLSQLHNLQTLHLDYSFVWNSGFPGLMLKHALHSAPKGVLSPFNSLMTVDYGSNVPQSERLDEVFKINLDSDGYPSCDPDQFMAWFHLPSVQSISIWLRSFQGVITQKEKQGNLNNVHTLVIARATIKEEDVPSLLSQMVTLKSLHLGMAYRWNSEQALESCSYILEGLESVSDTLEKLSMGIEYYPYKESYYEFGTEAYYDARNQFIGFLNGFSHLRSAEVPITLLVGWHPEQSEGIGDLLPETLEELCLQWDNSELIRHWGSETQLHDCVQYVLDSHLPHLKRIAIRCLLVPPDNGNYYVQERTELKDKCAEAGIDLEVVLDYLSPGLWTQNLA